MYVPIAVNALQSDDLFCEMKQDSSRIELTVNHLAKTRTWTVALMSYCKLILMTFMSC